jgi:hypothetical protein
MRPWRRKIDAVIDEAARPAAKGNGRRERIYARKRTVIIEPRRMAISMSFSADTSVMMCNLAGRRSRHRERSLDRGERPLCRNDQEAPTRDAPSDEARIRRMIDQKVAVEVPPDTLNHSRRSRTS